MITWPELNWTLVCVKCTPVKKKKSLMVSIRVHKELRSLTQFRKTEVKGNYDSDIPCFRRCWIAVVAITRCMYCGYFTVAWCSVLMTRACLWFALLSLVLSWPFGSLMGQNCTLAFWPNGVRRETWCVFLRDISPGANLSLNYYYYYFFSACFYFKSSSVYFCTCMTWVKNVLFTTNWY